MCPCFELRSTPGTPLTPPVTRLPLAWLNRCVMVRYTPELVLRFSKAQLDGAGACEYPPEFFVELIFSPVDSSGDASSGAFPAALLHHCGDVCLTRHRAQSAFPVSRGRRGGRYRCQCDGQARV